MVQRVSELGQPESSGSSILVFAAAPVAIRKTSSDVDVSLSTVIALNFCWLHQMPAAGAIGIGGDIAKHGRHVGRNHADPLQCRRFAGRPSIMQAMPAPLAKVSVVRMAFAAACQPASSAVASF